MKIYSVLFLMFAAILSSNAQALYQAEVKNVNAQEFSKIVKDGQGQLVDIRTPKEYDMGHIEGAVMIDYYASGFRENLSKLDKEKPVYIYCRSGNRTSRTVGLLEQMGFKKIVNLQRGLIDWSNSGYDMVQ